MYHESIELYIRIYLFDIFMPFAGVLASPDTWSAFLIDYQSQKVMLIFKVGQVTVLVFNM